MGYSNPRPSFEYPSSSSGQALMMTVGVIHLKHALKIVDYKCHEYTTYPSDRSKRSDGYIPLTSSFDLQYSHRRIIVLGNIANLGYTIQRGKLFGVFL